MSRKNFHSVPSGSKWVVKQAGNPSPVSSHRIQRTAEESARALAKASKGEAVFHRADGTIKDKDSFGNDPFPPKDRKH